MFSAEQLDRRDVGQLLAKQKFGTHHAQKNTSAVARWDEQLRRTGK
jgi:hypothetical protein